MGLDFKELMEINNKEIMLIFNTQHDEIIRLIELLEEQELKIIQMEKRLIKTEMQLNGLSEAGLNV